MRKPNRSAAVLLAALVAFPILNHLVGPASADTSANEDRTDSEVYTDARADYWQARADYAARKAATQAKKEAGEDVTPNGGAASYGADGDDAPASAPAAAPAAAVAAAPVYDGYPTNSQL